jgi:hypothetical protein
MMWQQMSKRRSSALTFALLLPLLIVVDTPAGHAAGQACPSFGNVQQVGQLHKSSINEASGLVASRNHNDRYWLHNDSGDTARIFAMTGNGRDRGTVKLGGTTAKDFEDIAIGPGPNANKDYLYIADIGNNGHNRATVVIHRIAEPTPPGAGQSITIPKDQIDSFVFAYANPNKSGQTWRRNAESLIVDPRSGDLVIIEKQLSTIDGRSDMGWVYRIGKGKLVEGVVIKAQPKVAIKQRRDTRYGPMTGADISADGSMILAKNGAETFAWMRGSDQTVFAALGAYPVTNCIAPKTPGEAIAFTTAGSAFLSVNEKVNSPVSKVSITGGTAPPPSGPTCNGLAATITGTAGDDVLIGTDGVDVIVGFDGNDEIYGKKGNDILCGGPGRDRIYGGGGRDQIWGGINSDVLRGGPGSDRIAGLKGNDKLFGHGGHDYLAGADGSDTLFGGDGDDTLFAGPGIDSCSGGPGDDTLRSCE